MLLPRGANPLLAVVELAHDDFARIFDPADIAHLPFVCGWALADIVATRAPG